jgi:hypothetical protein
VAYVKASQPKKWQSLADLQGDAAEGVLIDALVKELATKGSLHVLRHGFKCFGKTFQMAAFKPASGMNPDTIAAYAQNILTLTRQVRFNPDSEQSIDVVLAVNGIPVATLELKNPMTGQTVRDAQRQYEADRDPRLPLFRFKERALVHFAVDPDLVFMATRLEGKDTQWLPFNLGHSNGAGNPPASDGNNGGNYRTAYLWEEALTPDSLLDILARYIHLEVKERQIRTDKGVRTVRKESMIFPRYHQLKVVRKLVDHARANGSGHNYLIQHSAGSGKSNSIAWLAHHLAGLHDDKDAQVFDSVIVITDRLILDQQLQDTIYQFEHKRGVVEKIDEDTQQLAKALAGRVPIVIAAAVAHAVAQPQMAVQRVQARRGREPLRLQVEAVERLAHPELGLRQRARDDADRDLGCVPVRDVRQLLQPRQAPANGVTDRALTVGRQQRNVAECGEVVPTVEAQRGCIAAHPCNLVVGPGEIRASARARQRCVGVAWGAMGGIGSGAAHEVTVDAGVRLQGRVQARQLAQQLALTQGRPRIEGRVGRHVGGKVHAPVQVLAGVDAEQDVAQRRLQLARCDVHLVALMHGLERRREAVAQQGALAQHRGVRTRSHHLGRDADRAARARRAGVASLPELRGLVAADQLGAEAVDKPGGYPGPCPVDAADQGAQVELDQPDVRIEIALALQRFCDVARQPRLAVAHLVGLNPLHESPVVHRDQMHAACLGWSVVERLEQLVEQVVGRAALPGRRTVEVDLDRHPTDLAIPHAPLRQQLRNTKPGGEVLEERGLAVAGVAAQDDERHLAGPDGPR